METPNKPEFLMIYKVRIIYVFVVAILLLSSIVYFSFNLLGPSILGKSTEITVTKNNIFETDKKNTLDLLEQLKQNNEHNIVNQNKILELEAELKDIKIKLKSSFNISRKHIEKLKRIETTNTNSNVKWSISILMDLVDKLSKDKENNLDELKALTKNSQKLHRDLQLVYDQNEQIFSQLEDALTLSIGPLKNMLKSLGLPSENIIQQLRKNSSGKGGFFDPKALQSSSKIN